MSQPYEISYIPFCRQFEGNICHMYLDSDTPGNVTTGNGFLIPSATAACTFPFYLPGLHTPATAQEIEAEWKRVKAMQPGHVPAFYANLTALQLRQEDIDSHLLSLLDQSDDELQKDYSGFETFPDSVKMALLDMDYNLGDSKLRTTYPHFDAAIDRRDWETAATQCDRIDVQPSRNAWCAKQFNGQTETIGIV